MKQKYFLTFLLFLCSCAIRPTKIFESKPVDTKEGIRLSAKTVIVDARPAFEYSVSHLNGSINMRWEEFSQKQEPFLGELEPDMFFHARRLARYGIGIGTPVVVVGRGISGGGEEGRLTWTFKVYGIKDVQFTSIDTFNMPLTQADAPPRANVPIWKPELDETLLVSKKTFLNFAMKGRTDPDSPWVIDVRPEVDYLGKGPSRISKRAPDIGAINIPWTQFFDSKGEVAPEIKMNLESVGIHPQQKIFVIDEKGVRSAAVVLALRSLGYSNAANFAGGYLELVGTK